MISMSRKYAKISEESRRALISKDEEGGDYVQLALDLGIKRTTAISIVRSGKVKITQRGGSRQKCKKLSEQDLDKVIEQIENNPSLTLKQLCEEMDNRVCPSTLYKRLDGRLITYKMLKKEPVARNTHVHLQISKNVNNFH